MTIRNWRNEADQLLTRRERLRISAKALHAKIDGGSDADWHEIEGVFGTLQDLNQRIGGINPGDFAQFNVAAATHLGAAYDLAADFGAVNPNGIAVNTAIRALADENGVFRARVLVGQSIAVGTYSAAELADVKAALADLIAAL